MIAVSRVSKSFGRFRDRNVVLSEIDATFEPGVSYAILGGRGAGKSTLLRLLCGLQRPTRGRVRREGTVSLPLGIASVVAPYKTMRQLAAFLAVLYDADPREVVRSAALFSSADVESFDVPMGALPADARQRLNFGLGYALPSDIYLLDNAIGYGDADLQERCRAAFMRRRRTAGTILATRDLRGVERWADRGCVLAAGQLYMFDTVGEAVQFHMEQQLGVEGGIAAFAERMIKDGEREAAAQFLEDAIRAGAGSAGAYDLLADIRLADGRFLEAGTVARAAVERGHNTARNQMVLARAAEAEGRLQRRRSSRAGPWTSSLTRAGF